LTNLHDPEVEVLVFTVTFVDVLDLEVEGLVFTVTFLLASFGMHHRRNFVMSYAVRPLSDGAWQLPRNIIDHTCAAAAHCVYCFCVLV
jgi:hypothetical protein